MKALFLRTRSAQAFALCVALAFALCVFAGADEPQPKQFPLGAKPSPRHKVLAVPQHKPICDPPPQVARIPAQNSTFGNDQHGDCVTAEEAFSKACDGVFLSTQVVVDWARQHGFLEGADLISVLEAMATDGFPGPDGQLYCDGPHSSVAYGDEGTLQSALAEGNVKIAIDHNALPGTAGNQQGWYAVGGGNWPNIDHCVSICAYGTAEYLFSQLHVTVPPALAGTSGYLVDTWGTVGFVDHPWLMSAMAGAGEAYVRNPTTVEAPQPTPAPPKHHLTFAEWIQLLIARLHPHLTPTQAEAVADFFVDDNSPRVKLLKWIVYRRLVRAGLICEGDQIGAINWQELITIAKELEPILEPILVALIPILLGDEHAAVNAPAFRLCTAPKYRTECGPNGCNRVPIESNETTDAPCVQTVPAPPVYRMQRGASRPTSRRSFRWRGLRSQ